jgi:hypothetical protein
MRLLLVGVAFAVALSVGIGVALTFGGAGTSETTVEESTTESDSGLPAAVEEKHAALLAAAESGDYEALRELVPTDGFEYTFGGPVEGGAVAYWQELERTTDQRPLEALARVLRMPYVLSRGTYVWPWAYAVESTADLSAHERELLAPLGPLDTLFPAPGSGYFGWRAGILPDGGWSFFVAGD